MQYSPHAEPEVAGSVAGSIPTFSSPGPEVIKLFSSSAQLSMKFQLLINVEIVKISGEFWFKTQKLVIYPAHKCWHFNIYEEDKFQAQLS